MDQIKQNVAKNIARLRTSAHLTQAELAQRLCYSDKAVSKWERGESIPDISVLKQIADLFGVTVDYLITDTTDESIPLPPANRRRNHIIITLLSLAGVWFIALLIFTVFYTMNRVEWMTFLFAVPVSLIVGLVFASIWGTRMGYTHTAVLACVCPNMGRVRDCIHTDNSPEHMAALRRRCSVPDSSNFELWHTNQQVKIVLYRS